MNQRPDPYPTELARERDAVRRAAPNPTSRDANASVPRAFAREAGFTIFLALALTAVAVAVVWLSVR